jgi:GntR family transcriptional regulator / MocR family aminotransferase
MKNVFELAISLPDRDSRRLQHDLHRQLRSAIVEGRLQSGLRLPPTRALATSLGISRNTVVAAYDLLLSEGYLFGKAGSGTFVTKLHGSETPSKKSSDAAMDGRLAPYWRKQIFARPALIAAPQFDFRFGYPDVRHFPYNIWRRLSDRVLRQTTRSGAIYSDPEGLPILREAIVHHVSFSRAVSCQADEIIVTSGSQQAFSLIARVLVEAGQSVVAVEEPGYPPARAAFEAAGAKLRHVPVDEEGLIVERLPRNSNIICVTPTHQSPLGVTMSARRRAALLAFARNNKAVIVEDDYDSEYRYGGRPLDAMQTLDRDGSVFYIGTFTKSLLPSLRLAFVVAPPWARTALVAAKRITDGQCPALVQETLAAFILEGHLARYVRKMRNVYAGRHEAILVALDRHCADWLAPLPSSAGLHIAARFRKTLSAQAIVKSAAASSIQIEDLDRFAVQQPAYSGLAFGFGSMEASRINEGVNRLTKIIRKK